ncbi:Dabb family protein [Citrobacter freundii]|uniref:Dabb family protein n=1 Tax=Citrobacter freundii TaxID=546 RepID=UPI001EF0B49C|nr:Dabb family protein [Citrobacter freundii]
MIRHIVLLSLRKEISKRSVECLMRYFEYVANNVEGCMGFEWGENICNEDVRAGYTHCVVISFRSLIAKETYLILDEHQKLSARLRMAASDIAVADIDVSNVI